MNILEVILKINPNAEASTIDNDINQIIWHNGTTPIPKADIEAKQAELETAYNNNKYQRDRANDYPSIQDQLDMQYWDGINNTTTWKDAITKVKTDNPKS